MATHPLTKFSAKDIPGFHKPLSYLRWNNNGSYLAAVGNDKTIRISQFDATNTSLLSVNSISSNVKISQICWNPQESGRLALCSDEKSIDLWDCRGSRSSMKLQSLGSNLYLDWSPDGNYIVTGNSTNHLIVWDVRTGNQLKKKKFNYEVNQIAWTHNSDYILAATAIDNMGSLDVVSFHTEDLDIVSSHIAHCSNSILLQIDRSFSRVATSSFDQCITLWDLQTLTCQHTLPFEADIRNFSFSGKGDYLAVIVEDGSHIYIIDAISGEPVSKIPYRYKCSDVAWHPTEPVFVMTQDDRTSSSNSSSAVFLKSISFPLLKNV